MKKFSLLFAILCVCLLPTAHAGITGWNCADDGDGGIVTDAPLDASNWTDNGLEGGIPSYSLEFGATQYYDTAHMEGDFTVDGDPIVYLMEDVDNSTGFTWTAYDFKVYMTQPFTITTAFAPSNWDYTISPISGPSIDFPHDLGTGYMIDVYFWSTDSAYDIADGEMGTFGVRMQFDGSVNFCTEQQGIPEPATMALLGFGGLALLRRKK